MAQVLVFVYNADSGLFNTLTDIAHKLLSPSTYACRLCQLAYGNFSVQRDWADFIRDAPFHSEFLHRDEFVNRYGLAGVTLPAIYRKQADGSLLLCLDSAVINACESREKLKQLILKRCCEPSSETSPAAESSR